MKNNIYLVVSVVKQQIKKYKLKCKLKCKLKGKLNTPRTINSVLEASNPVGLLPETPSINHFAGMAPPADNLSGQADMGNLLHMQ